ncbi:protein YgfX [Aliidiomarina sp.]|uniref:protein YgfX n=1 Tax=Aliidiomarina sp. TaxID=1872439 RepID=UPI003A4D470D
MATYLFKFRASAISQQLLNTGYLACSLLAVFTVLVDLLILCSAITLWWVLRELEKRTPAEGFSCNEVGEGSYQGDEVAIQAGVILTPWLMILQFKRIARLAPYSLRTAYIRRTIFVDQVSAQDWARLQRIGLTLNARRR